MTEKEKMLRGALYDPYIGGELAEDRRRCKEKCSRYNLMAYTEPEKAGALLREMLGRAGKALCIEPPFWCDYGYGISVGENFYMNHGGVILDAGRVVFGDNVQIGPQCGFHTAGHPLDPEERVLGLEYAYPIKVGSNVWIGAGTQVMPGVTIGDNVVIGAGSVVTRDIPDSVVAVGSPCRVLRPITPADKRMK